MRIGIDIDGVLTDSKRYIENLMSKYAYYHNVSSYPYDWSKELNDKFWCEYLEYFYSNNEIRTFASEVIRLLKERGHQVIIITKKTALYMDDIKKAKYYQSLVINWLKKNDIIFDEIIFTRNSKEDICKDKKIDLMIDDEEQNIYPISQHIPVVCYDNIYNKSIEGPNIIRCYNWYDIMLNILKMEKLVSSKISN